MATAPPGTVLPVEQSRRQRVTGPLVLGGAALAASLVLHLRDPNAEGSYLFCPWLLLTGTYCPGCGGLRSVHAFSHGDLRTAVSSNALFVGMLPLLVLLWLRWFTERWRGRERRGSQGRAMAVVLLLTAVALVFGVLRNVPALAWLAPGQ